MSKKKYETTHKYDSTADKYDSRYRNIQKRKYLEVFTHHKIAESELIIDVGGGTGLLVEFLPKHQTNIIVCDISIEMLKIGKKKFSSGNFVCADSEHLPFRSNSTNMITCFSLLQNLQDPYNTLKESFKALKEEGILIITVLTKLFDENELGKILENVNFQIVKTRILSVEDLSIVAKKRRK